MKPATLLNNPALALAPMEGVTDAPMRALMTERGGFTYCVAEFLRVNDLVPPAHVYHRHIPELENGCRTAAGIPVHIQLLGGNPEVLAASAVRAAELGAHAVDLNFGCPAPTVNRHDGGATLLKYPERIEAIVRAVRQAVPKSIPVSAKFRLGWDTIDPIHENAERAAMGGADWITIHARTRMQAYQPPVYWKPIGEVKRRLSIPVVANGDIWTLDDFKRCREETECERYMLGRSAMADPVLPLQIAQELGIPAPAPAFEGWKPLLERFAELSDQYSRKPGQQGYVVQRIKQWIRMSHQRKPLEWFDILKTKQDLRELFEVVGSVYELPEHRIL